MCFAVVKPADCLGVEGGGEGEGGSVGVCCSVTQAAYHTLVKWSGAIPECVCANSAAFYCLYYILRTLSEVFIIIFITGPFVSGNCMLAMVM
jgi:hypothetical protein